MTVQELIDVLNKVEDRSKEVVEFNPDNGLYGVICTCIYRTRKLCSRNSLLTPTAPFVMYGA